MAEEKDNLIKRLVKWLFSIFALQAFVKNEHSSVTQDVPIKIDHQTDLPDPIKTAAIYASHMSREIDFCENFYNYACAKFPLLNPIPGWYNAVAATDSRVNDINKKFLVHMETNALQGPPVFKKIRAFFSSCMNEAAIDQAGWETLTAELKMVDLNEVPPFAKSVKWGYKYMRTLAKIHRNSVFVQFLFDVSVQINPKVMKVNSIFFGNTPATTHASMNVGTEGLYSFAKFSNVFNAETAPDQRRLEDIRDALKSYMKKVVFYMYQQTKTQIKSTMADLVSKMIDKVTNFLVDLEKTRIIGKGNRVENIHYTTVSGLDYDLRLMENTGKVQIQWHDYLSTLFAGLFDVNTKYFTKQDPILLIQNYKQFKEVMQIFHNQNKDVFISAMWFVVVHSLAPIGPKVLQNYHAEYIRTVYRVASTPRYLTCLNIVRTNFGFFVAHLLARYEEGSVDWEKLTEMVEHVRESLHETIERAHWMDHITKSTAHTKLSSLTYHITAWEKLKDPNPLEQLYGNDLVIGSSFQYTYTTMLRKRRTGNLGRLFTPNDPNTKPHPNQVSLSSRYFPSYVHLSIPAGVLGYPFYKLELEAFNYGALASQIASQLWHAVDVSGRNFDQHGDGWESWTPATYQEYQKREIQLVHFYSAIQFPEFGKRVDGFHTAIENAADMVGFEVGLRAYHKYLAKHGPENSLEIFKEFSHEQLYTLAFANVHCIHASLEYMYGQITEDENPPQAIRVNSVLTNSQEFSRIWKCAPDSQMSQHKVAIIP